MKLESSNKDQGIFVFQLDKNNYIKFCPKRGGVITSWVSDGNEILYFDEKRFMDKTKSIRGGIPILFPICGNLNASSSVFGKDYLQLSQHGFARDLQWQFSFNENEKILSRKELLPEVYISRSTPKLILFNSSKVLLIVFLS